MGPTFCDKQTLLAHCCWAVYFVLRDCTQTHEVGNLSETCQSWVKLKREKLYHFCELNFVLCFGPILTLYVSTFLGL